jgi:hypothetical protein
MEQQVAQTAAEQAQQQQAARAALDAVARARSHIIDSILTLRCPKCSKAFDNFDACFALVCTDTGGHGCGTQMCGFCLKDCGRTSLDCHNHVLICPYNINPGRSLFGKIEVFEAAQRERRKRLIHQYLDTLGTGKLRSEVLAALQHELQDLGIEPDALRGPAPPVTAVAVVATTAAAVPASSAVQQVQAIGGAGMYDAMRPLLAVVQERNEDGLIRLLHIRGLHAAAQAASESLQWRTELLLAGVDERRELVPEQRAAERLRLQQRLAQLQLQQRPKAAATDSSSGSGLCGLLSSLFVSVAAVVLLLMLTEHYS